MKSNFESIGPKKALQYLSNAVPNRKISKHFVDKYADDMICGRWRTSFQGIAFDSSGRLIDGQHRLHAVVKSGMEVTFLIFREVDLAIADAIDTGKPRSFTDFSNIEGEKRSHHYEATLRAMFPNLIAQNRFTVPMIRELSLLHSEAVTWTLEQFSTSGSAGKGVNNSVIRGVVARAYYSVPLPRLAEFIDVVKTGMMNSPRDAAAVLLRNYLLKAGSLSHRGNRYKTFRKCERALQAFVVGEQLNKLFEAEDELFTIPPFRENSLSASTPMII